MICQWWSVCTRLLGSGVVRTFNEGCEDTAHYGEPSSWLASSELTRGFMAAFSKTQVIYYTPLLRDGIQDNISAYSIV